jgi:uncharacterized phage protein (TIGR01671 family)
MREILFRGKLKCDGEWVEGYYLKKEENKHYMVDKQEPFYSTPYFYEVIPETVGQYTCLTDKNGKKIFEGDIVTNSCGIKETVEFYKGRYYPFIAFPEYNCWDEKECEVIGNIHDNPELLGGEEVE